MQVHISKMVKAVVKGLFKILIPPKKAFLIPDMKVYSLNNDVVQSAYGGRAV